MRKNITAAAVIAAAAIMTTTTPASAVRFSAGLSGSISVGPDFGACATVTAPSPWDTIVGSFTAAGEMQGPGTRVGTVRYAEPFVAQGYWSGCIDGAYLGATAGEAKYVLHAHRIGGEFAEVQHCVVNRGVVTCV
ncbi:MAG TPA: hypothetical protein VNA20_01990 [Frankiaceae bacterium]|nr:hypothetical protein [Frankiaceae bacterium]